MTLDFAVRRAAPADVPGMARVIVDCWRETYRGLMRDSVLDDPGLVSRRERFWTAALTDPRYAQNSVWVAVHEGALIGVAMSGPPLDAGADRNDSSHVNAAADLDDASPLDSVADVDHTDGPRQLYVLYVYAAFHGSGVGQALLDAVLNPDAPAVLWVADPNPRAQAFYRKHGFARDGAAKVDDGVREIRMLRPARAAG
jgi:ribosomal protein S18 acetylase RimI-like enzyme